MKKLTLVIILTIFLSPLVVGAEKEITITEIMYDYPGSDDGHEWIEGYFYSVYRNFSSYNRFLEGGTKHSVTYIQGGVFNTPIIEVGEYFVIAENSNQFLLDHPNFSGKLFDSSFSLSNTGEIVAIINSDGTTVYDEVNYSSGWGASGDGNSLQLSEQGWVASTPTPGGPYVASSAEEIIPVITVSGEITSDATWSPEDGIYYLDGKITVSASSTLTILPGTIIKAKPGGSVVLEVYGNLVAISTESQKIIFTSMFDAAAGGKTTDVEADPVSKDWQGVYFKEGSSGSLSNVEIRYAGYGGGPNNIYGVYSSIENNGGSVHLDNVSIDDGSIFGIRNLSGAISILNSRISGNAHGVSVEGGKVDIKNSTIENNSDYGIYVFGEGITLNLESNSFSGNKQTALIDGRVSFTHSGNTSSDVTKRGFELSGESRDGDIWHSSDLPIIIGGGFYIPVGRTLTISPGTVVKMGDSAYIQVEGSLIVKGDKGNEVRVTSLRDGSVSGDTNGDGSNSMPIAGNWSFVLFTEGSRGEISYTDVKYAGAYIYPFIRAGLLNRGGVLNISNSKFDENMGSDIYQESGNVTVTDSKFSGIYNHLTVTGGEASISKSLFNKDASAIDNRSASSAVTALHNWWGDASGPRTEGNPNGLGSYVWGNVLYDPWIKRDPSLPNPVIIVPGMTGSRLNDSEGEIWPNIINLAFSGEDSYLKKLLLPLDGIPDTNSFVEVKEVIKSINIPLFKRNIFEGLENKLEAIGYFENQQLFFFPYDWRLDLSLTATKLANYINDVRLFTGAEKVNLVAHSMGGLLTKEYFKQNNQNYIDLFVDISTPHSGSPKAINVLLSGDMDISIANKNTMKLISQNMPAVYQLLPSRSYFDDSDNNYKYYVFDGINGNKRLSFDQTKDYLKFEGRNALLVDRADEFHQEIDGLDPRDYGVETYNIVGCGTPTLGQFYVLDKQGDHYNYNIKFINGDGTVPLKSALAMPAEKTYYVKGVQHAVMPSASGIKELIASILTGETYNILSYPNVSLSESGCKIPDGKIVSLHSPINLNIYDGSGNHTGPDSNGDIENNISGVVYEMVGDNSFAFLPDGLTYQVSGVSTGSGSFDLRIEIVKDEEVAETTIFTSIPLSETTRINFDLGETVPNQIYLDNDGDGGFETTFSISTTSKGFLESTGKNIIEKELDSNTSVITSAGGSFSSANKAITTVSREPEFVKEQEIAIVQNKKIIQNTSLAKPIDDSQKESIVEDERFENTAIVYKSFGQKLIDLLKSIWRWFISKF